MSLSQRFKDCAYGQGLAAVGIGPIGPLEQGLNALTSREARGYFTPFACGTLQERCFPLTLLPQARSMAVIALNYFTETSPALRPNSDEGIICRSGRGPDYHYLLRSRLEALATFLKREAGSRFIYLQIDSGPLIEREAARLAGLGYYGQNCSLIVPGYGSWVALGVLLVDVELEYDSPIQRNCTGCGRCLTACPTGALVEPYNLNPSRCLSYLTQKRGFIPEEIRPAFANHLFGCDVCQEVCPENKGPKKGGGGFDFRRETAFPKLEEVLKLDNRSFQLLFGNSGAGWRGKGILQRNAALAMGNSGDRSWVPYLTGILESPSPVLRAHAAWALGQLGGRVARSSLERALAVEYDLRVEEEIKKALDRA